MPRFATLAAMILLLAMPAAAQAGGRVVSVAGEKQVGKETLYVDVWVVVPAGKSERQAKDEALAEQGARPQRKKPPRPPGGGGGGGSGSEYFYTGLKWTTPVTQNYNPAGAPLAAQAALTNTHSTWNAVPGSTFRMGFGGTTSRCPSLVQQCPGPQVKDPYNDVGWLSLGGSTLGVTWSTASSPEADMALSTRFSWKNTCASAGSGYDVESVLLHENGHVAGLDHPNRTDSVMYASYQGARCTLYPYDEQSLDNLY